MSGQQGGEDGASGAGLAAPSAPSVPEGAAPAAADAGKPPVDAGAAEPDATSAGEIESSPATVSVMHPPSSLDGEAGDIPAGLARGEGESTEAWAWRLIDADAQLRITAKRDGFRRGGVEHRGTVTRSAVDFFHEQLVSTLDEPLLVIQVLGAEDVAAPSLADVPVGAELVTVVVENGRLVVSIGVASLAYAVQADESNWASDFYVSDIEVFARAVAAELRREEDDGTTPVHKMLDAAAQEALESGCDGVEDGDVQIGLKLAAVAMGRT